MGRSPIMIITDKYLRKLVWGIGFALFCALIALFYSYLFQKNKRVFISVNGHRREVLSFADFIIFFVLTVVASIRLNVGSDYYNYYTLFNSIPADFKLTKDLFVSQSGFYLLSYFVKLFTDNEYAIFAVVAIILYAFLFYLFKEEVEDRPAALTCYLFLGFYANSLNLLKQCIAMMFVMCFYRELRKHHILTSILFAMLAVLFHYSAIFVLVIIGIVTIIKIEPTIKLFYLSIATGLLFAILLPELIKLVIHFVPSASGYGIYINWRRNNQIRLVLGVLGTIIIYLLLINRVVREKDPIKAISNNRYYELTFLIIGLCINIASIRIWVVQRIALYFYQFIILILPAYFQSIEVKRRNNSKVLLYSIMFVYLVFSGIFLGENEYYSYNTVFSGDSPIYDADFNQQFR